MNSIYSVIISLLAGSSVGFKLSEIFQQTVYDGLDIVTVNPLYWTLSPGQLPDCDDGKCLLDPGVTKGKRAFVRMELYKGQLLPRSPGGQKISKVYFKPLKRKEAYAGINIFVNEYSYSLHSLLAKSILDNSKLILSVDVNNLDIILSVNPKVISEKVGLLHVRFPADPERLAVDTKSIKVNIEKIRKLGYNINWIVSNQNPKYFRELVKPDKLHVETILPKTVDVTLYRYGEFDFQARE